jgi:hypothetical protein
MKLEVEGEVGSLEMLEDVWPRVKVPSGRRVRGEREWEVRKVGWWVWRWERTMEERGWR